MEKRLDIQSAGLLLLDDSDFEVLPLLRLGCEKCAPNEVYCVECTLKLYEILNSGKFAEFYALPLRERHEIFVALEEAWEAQRDAEWIAQHPPANDKQPPALNPAQLSFLC